MNGKDPDVGEGASWHGTTDEGAARIGLVALATWQRTEAALSPVIGHAGVAAIYRRSLFLSRAAHPWLPGAQVGALDPVEFTELHVAMARCNAREAQEATDALIRTFRDLLAELIGSSLAERLLPPASTPTSHGGPVQEELP